MGIITLQAPTIGQPNSTEAPKVDSNFTALQTLLNGNLDTSNLSASAALAATQLTAAVQQALFAPGDLKVTAAATAVGFLFCDGSAVSRTGATTALFAAISTAYGVGDGSTTFNLPDYRGRVIVGAGTGPGLTLRSLGQTSGEEGHQLSIPEMPGHNHPVTDAGHFHALQGSYSIATTGIVPGAGALSVGSPPVGAPNTATATTGVGTSGTGGNGTHNTMQPYGVANVFIKT